MAERMYQHPAGFQRVGRCTQPRATERRGIQENDDHTLFKTGENSY